MGAISTSLASDDLKLIAAYAQKHGYRMGLMDGPGRIAHFVAQDGSKIQRSIAELIEELNRAQGGPDMVNTKEGGRKGATTAKGRYGDGFHSTNGKRGAETRWKGTYKCSKCPYTTRTRKDLKGHYIDVHELNPDAAQSLAETAVRSDGGVEQ